MRSKLRGEGYEVADVSMGFAQAEPTVLGTGCRDMALCAKPGIVFWCARSNVVAAAPSSNSGPVEGELASD